jgi:hypothetical protein
MPRKFAVVEQLGNTAWRKGGVMVIGGWLSRRFQASSGCLENTSLR